MIRSVVFLFFALFLTYGQVAAEVERGTKLGVALERPTATVAGQLSLPEGVGFVVTEIAVNGPGATAGLLVHDVVTQFDGQWLINGGQLAVLLKMHEAGDEITLTLFRNGREFTVPVVLQKADTHFLGAKECEPQGRSVRARDEDGEALLFRQDGELTLKVSDKNGTVVFLGGVDSPEQIGAVPERWRTKLPSLKRGLTRYPTEKSVNLSDPLRVSSINRSK